MIWSKGIKVAKRKSVMLIKNYGIEDKNMALRIKDI